MRTLYEIDQGNLGVGELFSALAMRRSCNLEGYPDRPCSRARETSDIVWAYGSQLRPADQDAGIFRYFVNSRGGLCLPTYVP